MCSVRPESYDWAIYHAIDEEKGCTIDEIRDNTGFTPDIVQESLARLISYLLVECRGEHYRVCSLEQILITGQLKQDPFSDIIIENGVVKVKSTVTNTSEGVPKSQNGDES